MTRGQANTRIIDGKRFEPPAPNFPLAAGSGQEPLRLSAWERFKFLLAGIVVAAIAVAILVFFLILGSLIAALIWTIVLVAVIAAIFRAAWQRMH